MAEDAVVQNQQATAARLAEAKQIDDLALRQAAAGDIDAQIKRLTAQTATLRKDASPKWKGIYLGLTVGAGIVDLLEFVDGGTLTDIVSVGFSLLRMGGLWLADSRPDPGYNSARMQRGIAVSAIEAIPLVNDLPLQSVLMAFEWVKRDAKARKANVQLRAIDDRIRALRKSLPN